VPGGINDLRCPILGDFISLSEFNLSVLSKEKTKVTPSYRNTRAHFSSAWQFREHIPNKRMGILCDLKPKLPPRRRLDNSDSICPFLPASLAASHSRRKM
jgi:hypothetical protein